MDIRSAALGAARPAAVIPAAPVPALQPTARDALKAALDARRSAVAHDAAQARQSPRFEAQETRKQQARAKLQQVREWLKIVRKLYAQNPTGMARSLAQVFKDLKAAVQAYRDAGGREMGDAASAVDAVLAPPPPAAAAGKADEAREGPDAAEASNQVSAETDAPAPAGPALYDAVVGEVRKMIGEDGLQFLKEVRGLADEVKKLLETARGQAAARPRDKDTDQAFEDSDKALKALHETLDQMDRDIRQAAPTAGMRLSIEA